MTREEILALEAGRGLDTLMATQVMEWHVAPWSDETDGGTNWIDSTGKCVAPHSVSEHPRWRWSPSTDFAAAWMVMEKLRDMWTVATQEVDGFDNDFGRPFDDGVFFDVLRRNADRRWPWALLYLTPEIICRAALLAVMT